MTSPAPTNVVAYPEGTDCEWFACDADGCVAAFTTAGNGPIPTALLRGSGLNDFVRRLPERGAATLLVSLPRPDDFLHFASRGLFAYDWKQARGHGGLDGRYEMLARPQRPLHLADLPEPMQPLLRGLTLPGVRFADTRSVDVRRSLDCEPKAWPPPA